MYSRQVSGRETVRQRSEKRRNGQAQDTDEAGEARDGLERKEGRSRKLLASKSNYFILKELRI